MKHQEVGSITFNPNSGASLDDALDIFRRLKHSSDAGWEAFYRLDYQLSTIKDCLCKKCLLKVEALNGKKVYGQDKSGNQVTGKKVRRSKRCA